MHATVLTVETGKRMTGLLVSVPMLAADTDTDRYWWVSVDTRYRYRSNPTANDAGHHEKMAGHGSTMWVCIRSSLHRASRSHSGVTTVPR